MSHIRRSAIRQILLGVCLIAIFGSLHVSVQAQDPPMPEGFLATHDGTVVRSELDAAEAASLNGLATPQAEILYYKWYAGSVFHPRFSTTGYTYEGNGCISATSDAPFTTDLQVPEGARLYGVRYYFYDMSAGSSSLFASNYDGLGAFVDFTSVASTDNAAGYGSAYLDITPNYTVDNFLKSLAINWYPNVTGSTMRLCGARAFYSLGATTQRVRTPDGNLDTPQAPLAEGYLFIAGSSFIRRSSATAYAYENGTGCIYSTTGGIFTADINLPKGYQIFGHRMYYYDTGPGVVTTFLTDYNGAGTFNEPLSIASTNAAGYTSRYENVASPYYVDQYNASLAMAVNLNATDNTVRFCGVRVYYTSTPTNPTAQANVALPRTQPSPNEPTIAAAAQSAPNQAVVATAQTLNSEGLVVAPAARSTTASFADEMVAPTALNGVRYGYRWIAGSNFTPRSSAYAYAYGGAGCTYTTNDQEAITAPLHLPDGATIEGVRIYYYDLVASDGTVYLTTYDGAGNFDDLLTVSSLGATGYGERYSGLATAYVVANKDTSYVLTWRAGTSGAGMQFCGARVFYSVPSFAVYMPLIVK